jgi:hypothetical protein
VAADEVRALHALRNRLDRARQIDLHVVAGCWRRCSSRACFTVSSEMSLPLRVEERPRSP